MPQWPLILWPMAKIGGSINCKYVHRSRKTCLFNVLILIITIAVGSCVSCLMAVAAAATPSPPASGSSAGNYGRLDTVASLTGLSNGYATPNYVQNYYQESLQHSAAPLQHHQPGSAIASSANSFAGLNFDNFDVNYGNAATTATDTNDNTNNSNNEDDDGHQHSAAVDAVDIFNSGFIPTTLTAAGQHYAVASNTKQNNNNNNRFTAQSFDSSSSSNEFQPLQHSYYTTDNKMSPTLFGGRLQNYVVAGTSNTADIDAIDLNGLQQGYALTYDKANTLQQPQLQPLTATTTTTTTLPTQHQQQQFQFENQANQKDYEQHDFDNYFTPFHSSIPATKATNAAEASDLLTYKQQQPRAVATQQQQHTFLPLNNYQYDNIAEHLSGFNRNNNNNHNQQHETNQQQQQQQQYDTYKLQAFDSYADSTNTNNHHYLPMPTAAIAGNPNEYGNKSLTKNKYRLWQHPNKQQQHSHSAVANYRQYSKGQQQQNAPQKYKNTQEQLTAESALYSQKYKSNRSDGTSESYSLPEHTSEHYQQLQDLQEQLNQQQKQFQQLQHQLIEHDQQLQIQSHQQHSFTFPTPQPTAPTLPPITQTVHHTAQSLQALAGIPLAKHTHVIRNVPVRHHQQIYVPHKQEVQVEVQDTQITTVKNPVPIQIPVSKTIAVPDLREVTIPIEKVKPFPVERPVPFLVEKRVPYRVEKQIAKPIYYPVPIKVPIIHTIVHKLRSHLHPHGHGHGGHVHPHLHHPSHLAHHKPITYHATAHSIGHSYGHNLGLSHRHSLNQDLGIGQFAGNLLK